MKLREYIDKHQFSLRGLEKAFGVSYQTIFKITRGYTISWESASKIVKATDGEITYEDLGFVNLNGVWVKKYGKIPT